MNTKLEELSQNFKNINPTDWDSIPDIDLYIDQILEYMKRQHPGLNLNESLTSSMVNNYAKQGLLPRAKGKKYNREHISCLTIICLLKQVISVTDTKFLIDDILKDDDYQSLYKEYTDLFAEEATKLCDTLSEEANNLNDNSDTNQDNDPNINKMIIKMAITSYLYKFACQYLITNLKESDDKNDK